MKKIISALLILVMIFSVAAVNASAAGVYLKADFSTMTEEQLSAQFHKGEFFIDDGEGVLCGYYEAKALESTYNGPDGYFDNTLNTWLTYDTSVTFAMADDEVVDSTRSVSIAYCNDNRVVKGLVEKREFVTLTYDIDSEEFRVSAGDFPCYNEEFKIGDAIPMDLDTDGETFYTIGMSVEKNHIRFFFEDQLLYDIDGTAMCVGESINSPFFLWNDGNFLKISDITIASETYLYPPMNSNPTDTTATQPVETTTRKEVVDVTDEAGNAVTDASGNKVTEEIIITDAPVADTNTGAVQGGTSTNTGDVTFIVVCAMVAALGCAVIVRKVNVR